MMAFDQGAQEWVAASPKYSSITNFAIAQVAKVNGVLVNTGLHTNYWLRLVDVVAVDARQTAITGDANLNPMKNAVVGGEEPWDIVATRREASGADLVNLMINTGSRYGNTGYGDITTGANGDEWAAKVDKSFTCTSIHAVEVDYTLAHEVGHNMGLGHSDKQKSPGSSGAFTYSRGYYFKANGKNYHTVMAYSQDGYGNNYTETPYYSSPDYTYIENDVDTLVPVGLADANDCTRALRQTCAYIAKRKATKIPFDSDVVFSPDADTACVIALSSPGGYPIRYTTDGSEPTRTSELYSEPILLTKGTITVKAVAIIDSSTLGAMAEKTYTAAVDMDEYVWLEDDTEDWKWGYWYDQDGNDFFCYDWTGCTSETAVLAMGGSVNVDTTVNLGTLVADGSKPLEIVVTENPLSASRFEALGDTTLTGTNYSFGTWSLYPGSTLTLSPGNGETLTYANTLYLSDSTATLVFSNGTVNVTAPDSAAGCFGTAAIRVANGGTLAIGSGGWKTGYANTSPLTIDKGGKMRIDVIECIHRPLTLAGGTIEVNAKNSYGRALELRDTVVTVTEDSCIRATNSGGDVMANTKDFTFDVRKGKTLAIESMLVSNGNLGLVKTGYGTLQLETAPEYTGATIISKGTLAVDYSSTSAPVAGWTVTAGATLKVNEGKQLTLPSLTLKRGAALSLPAASTAALTVNSDVSLYGVETILTGAEDLTLGARYPLVKSTGTISSAALMSTDSMPMLGDGLVWIFETVDNVLYACIANETDRKRDVPFICNNPSLILKVPSDSTPHENYGVKISSTPLVLDDMSTTSITISMQFVVPDDGFGSNGITLCGWNSGENIIRCIVNSDGKLDCNFANSSHTSYTTLSPVLAGGVHVIDIAYSSVTNTGTHVMLDGELVYDDSTLVFSGSGNPVTRVVFGGDVKLGSVGTGLDILACGIVDPTATAALPCMTISGGSVSYNYFTPKFASIYPLLPHGGYKMNASAIDATYSGSYDAVSISVVAEFPADKVGSIIAMGMGDWVTTQAEYEGDGTFALRYDGYDLNNNPATTLNIADSNVATPHLYTLTYAMNGNLCFYQDGIEILRQETLYVNKSMAASYKFTFGAGCWHPWQGSGNYNSNPMPDFKVRASHIALGTSDRTVSEEAVMASMATDDDDPSPPETPATVDVLVAYDNGAQAYVANKGVTLTEFAATQIEKMNAVLATNRLDRFYSYRLAGVCKVDATYANIEAVSGDLVSGAGPLVTLRSSRELCGADTVTLLVNTSGATLGDSIPLSSSTDVANQHECAFSVCSISAVDTGTQYTMIHENAHNMGCGHSRKQDRINSPFEYGRGYYFMDGETKRHTIMAYDVDGTGVYAHPSPYFSTTSTEFGFALGDATNNNARVLKETCGEVAKWRDGAAIALAGVEVSGVALQTSARYPWSVDGNGVLRSFNQTDYQYQCTTPLKATIEGPRRLSFKHKSYFGGESVAGNNYSHFDVLLDDSPVLTQTECTNEWRETYVDVPEGEHEVTFVFSQRFAMNNDKDYKDGTPEADDGVWLKELSVGEIPTVAPFFDWTPNNAPTGGWVASWGGEANNVTQSVVGPDGWPTNVYRVTASGASKKWSPYQVSCTAKDAFTFVTYGCADAVSATSTGPAILWCMGRRGYGNITMLVKDGDGHIRLVSAPSAATSYTSRVDLGKVAGWHLFTVRFSTTGGVSVQIDDREPVTDSTFAAKPSNGIQIGSLLGGIESGNPFSRGAGFAVLRMIGYETADLPAEQYAALCAKYPAATCAHSSTSDEVSWTFPQDATKVPESYVDGLVLGETGITQALGFGSTNAVVASVLAELPDGVRGEIAGCHVYRASSGENFYAFAYSNGDGTFSLGHGTTTNYVTSSAVADWTAPHVWTFAFAAQTGARLYCDGVKIASTEGIKWNNTSVTGAVAFGDDPRGGWSLSGAKIYAVHTDFGVGNAIFTAAEDAANSPLADLDFLAESSDESIANQLAEFIYYKATGVTTAEITDDAVLHISEICPKPTARDPNGVEAGWIEIHNTSDTFAANLSDYSLTTANRGSEIKAAAALPDMLVRPGEYKVIYTTKEYPKEGVNDGSTPFITNGIIVAQLKINPKKFPVVQLRKGKEVVDSFIVPVDLPDNASFAPAGGAWGDYSGATVEPDETEPVESAAELVVDDSMLTISSSVTKDATDGFYSFADTTSGKDGIMIDNSATAQMAAKDMYSISLTFRVTNNTATSESTGMPLFFCRNSSTSTPYSGILAYINKDPYANIIIQIRDANKTLRNYHVDSELNWLDGEWHTLAVSCGQTAASRISVSVDGVNYVDTTCGVAAQLNTSMPMCVGRAYDSSSWTAFTGDIKDIHLYTGDAFPAPLPDPAEVTSDKTEIVDATTVTRVILPTITPGAANNRAGEVAYGPNAGPLYGIKHKVSDWKAWDQAKVGEDYPVTLALNPMDDDPTNVIQSVSLAYRTDFGEIAFTSMIKGALSKEEGQLWTATIPGSAITQAGHILRWAAVATDAAGNKWRTPSFCDPDNAYEWYGTLIEPPEGLLSEKLQTFHIFADATAQANMDKQYDSIAGSMPYGARVQIYDSQTGFYYDNVRIDLRGNTTAGFRKKSHGIRFIKSQPLTCTNPFTGEVIDGLRKVSFIAEYSDPAFIRQALAFQMFKDMGLNVPYSYPVRLNMNGEFFQMAFHSNRFTDELIEDYYGLDPLGYAYKSVGTLRGATSAGGTEKKTPDDGNDKELSALSAFYGTFSAADDISESFEGDGMDTEIPAVTKTVVKKFDLPAWLNYLAAARITQECDDVWANLCAYYDVNGTDTWMPLGYDFNVSLGAIYLDDSNYKTYKYPIDQTMANVDNFKSHPFYGGNRVRCHRYNSDGTINYGNRGFEAVWQSPKFRRLYLRRLRTVMDEQLKTPGTTKDETPFWSNYVVAYTNAITADAALDRAKWGYGNGTTIYWWPNALNLEEGIADLWDNYVVPRREHLFVTHSVNNTEKAIGYGKDFNAGIPNAQSPIADLKAGFSVDNTTDETKTAIDDIEKIVIRNANAEAVDMSGWRLTGRFVMTLPAGTVVDSNDTVTVVVDRRAYVAAHDAELTDQVIVGNAKLAADTTSFTLFDANGTEVVKVAQPSDESKFLRILAWDGIPVADDDNGTGEWVKLTNISDTATLDLTGVNVKIGKDTTAPKCNITLAGGTLPPGGTITLKSSDFGLANGWEKITNGAIYLQLTDANGTIGLTSEAITQKSFAGYEKGNVYLQVTSFGASFGPGDLVVVPYPVTTVEVVPGEDAALEATTPEEAEAALADCEIVLTAEEEELGLTNVLKLVAVPVVSVDPSTGDETISYVARVEVDETKVDPPAIAEPATQDDKPVTVEDDDDGKTVVSAKISNAVIGLWYGYEVADELGESAVFGNDVGSFDRATNATHKIKGSPRTQPSGFFRVKVLPAKPDK